LQRVPQQKVAIIRLEDTKHKIMENFEDIINLPHHTSKVHRPMPRQARAAQFAAFAALSGYEEAIDKTKTKHLKEFD